MANGISRHSKPAAGDEIDTDGQRLLGRIENQDKARDPDGLQTRQGDQWCFGRKAHVDGKDKLILVATAANVADSTVLPELLRGGDTRSGVTMPTKENGRHTRTCLQAKDLTNRRYRYKDRVGETKRRKPHQVPCQG